MLLRVGGKIQEAPVLRGWRIWVTEGILVYGAMCLNLGPELNVSMRERQSLTAPNKTSVGRTMKNSVGWLEGPPSSRSALEEGPIVTLNLQRPRS